MQLPLKHPIFKILSGIAAEKGIEAYVIGGYVRDLLLQRPSQDIDIVVHGSGIELAETAARRLGNLRASVFKTSVLPCSGIKVWRSSLSEPAKSPTGLIHVNPSSKKERSTTTKNAAILRSMHWLSP